MIISSRGAVERILVICTGSTTGLQEGFISMKYTMMIIMFLLATEGLSETYYVSSSGDDSWSGTSPDSAFATLQHSADIVSPGDSVITLDGTYAGFDLRTSGSETQPIVFTTQGSGAWIDEENPVTPDGINLEGADWVTVEGFNLTGLDRNGIRAALSDHVTIRDCYCENCFERGIFTGFCDWITIEDNECCGSMDEHGIYHSNSGDHPVIVHNICHDNNGCGIHMNGDLSSGGDGTISDAWVEGNIIYNNGQGGGSGINCDGVVQSTILNNLVYGNHSSGISLYQIDGATGSHDVEVCNNTIVQADDGRWGLNINTGSTDCTVLNNIILSAHPWRGSIAIDTSSQPGFQSGYNLTEDRFSTDGGDTVIDLQQWQAAGYGDSTHVCSSWEDTFSDWSGGNYHLAAGSQALDMGTSDVQGIVTCDLEGVPRPQGPAFDIGCYESWPVGMEGQGSGSGSQPVVMRGQDWILFTGLGEYGSVSIYDLCGRVMRNIPIVDHGTAVLFTSDLPPAIYLYRIDAPQEEPVCGKLMIL